MKKIQICDLENYNGGDFISGLCVGLGAGSVVYAGLLATQFWNPVGWVSAGFLVADAACLGYAYDQLN